MIKSASSPIHSHQAVQRLTALWALNEAGLGGLMHAVGSSFTGAFVGGAAVVLISLIAHFADHKLSAILRALTVVLIIKLMVSPHSPLQAYFAVTFQAVAGVVLFSLIANHRLAAMLLAIIGLMESALQKLLVTTLVFGKSIWVAIDEFTNFVVHNVLKVSDTPVDFSASLWLIGIYLGIYLLFGIAFGWVAGALPSQIRLALQTPAFVPQHSSAPANDATAQGRKPRPWWRRPWVAFLVPLVFIVLTMTFLKGMVDGSGRGALAGAYVALRATLILVVWYFVLAPVLMRALRRFLKRKSTRYSAEVEGALQLLPELKSYARQLWSTPAQVAGWRRWRQMLIALIAYALTFEPVGVTRAMEQQVR